MDDILLELRNLRTTFRVESPTSAPDGSRGGSREVAAVDGASLKVRRGQIVALVGESGCGKTVLAYSVLRLIRRPGRIAGGQILLRSPGSPEVDIAALDDTSPVLYGIRGRLVGMIFQEPSAALSPVHTIGNQITEAILLHQDVSARQATQRAADLLTAVGIPSPLVRLRQYPHEMSGGMRQRAVIAMAIACNPQLLIADEPTTALDVTLQAQMLNLIKKLRSQLGMSVLLITHDLGVVAQMADEVAVMYMGRIIERGPLRAVLRSPLHPYTRGLLDSLPSRTPKGQPLPSIPGTVPPLTDLPSGCPFHPRCRHCASGRCDEGRPPAFEERSDGHGVACLRAGEMQV